MGNWFKDLVNSNKKYYLYYKEVCAATGKIIYQKRKVDCKNCEFAEMFLKTGKRVDIDKLLNEANGRMKYSKEILN